MVHDKLIENIQVKNYKNNKDINDHQDQGNEWIHFWVIKGIKNDTKKKNAHCITENNND